MTAPIIQRETPVAVPVKNCPFCDSTRVTIGYNGQPATSYYALCIDCYAQGPEVNGVAETFAAWNRRKDAVNE